MFWNGEKQTGDLTAAIEYFHSKLPGWWFSVGSCHVSADASVAPDSAGQDEWLYRHEDREVVKYFDSGFHLDLLPPATMADSLRKLTDIAWLARDTFCKTNNLANVREELRVEYGMVDEINSGLPQPSDAHGVVMSKPQVVEP